MKVQAYKDTAKRSYPALAKVAALVAVSCVVSACQPAANADTTVKPAVPGGTPGVPMSHQIILGKDKK